MGLGSPNDFGKHGFEGRADLLLPQICQAPGETGFTFGLCKNFAALITDPPQAKLRASLPSRASGFLTREWLDARTQRAGGPSPRWALS